MYVIYKITNIIENKSYIGQTTRDINKRFEEHCNTPGKTLYDVIKKYGKENFTIEIIDNTASNYEELDLLEDKYILEFNTLIPNGYNSKRGGGARHFQTEETKKKMSKSKKGKYTGKDNSFYGKNHNEKTKRKISEAHKGSKNWCSRKIIDIDENKIYSTAKEAAIALGIKDASNISRACKLNNKRKVKGHRIMYYEDYLNIYKNHDNTEPSSN